MRNCRHTARGFTAVELMIVLAIAAILVAAAVPNFAHMLQRHRATTAANEVLRAFTLARSQALSTAQRVAIAPTTGTDWTGGWRVFVDGNNNGAFDAGTDAQIETFPPLRDIALSGTAFGENGNSFVSFNQFGFARALNGTTMVSGRVGITLGDNELSVCLGVNGRAAVLKGTSC